MQHFPNINTGYYNLIMKLYL